MTASARGFGTGHGLWLLTGALALSGCEREAVDTGVAAVVRTDSAGIEIVQTNTPAWADGGAWTVDPEIGNDNIVAVATGALDVERVHVYRIRRP